MKDGLKKLLFLISITLLGLGVVFSASLLCATGFGSISGRVTDADTGTGLAEVYIVCYPWGYQTQTNILGEYTVVNLPPDSYSVTASLSGYHYTVVENVTVAGSGPGLNQENIDLAMSPASNAMADGYENDDTFEEATIIWVDGSISVLPPQVHNFHQSGDQDWVKFYALGTISSPTPYTIKTSNLGSYCDTVITLYDQNQEIVRGPVDDYWEGEDEELSWNCPAEGYYYVKISSGQPTLFGENTNYELSVYIPVASTPGIITGTIENSLNSDYITGANLTTDTGGTALSLTGHYVMTVPAGQCTVTASKEGYHSSSFSSIIVTEAEETTVDFSLMPGGGEDLPPCPATVVLKEEDDNLSLLRRFRDEVLAEDQRGQEYIDLFYRHAPELSWLLLRNPELKSRTANILRRLLPQIRSLLEGKETIFTQEITAEINSLVGQFETQSSLELRDVIEVIREELFDRVILE